MTDDVQGDGVEDERVAAFWRAARGHLGFGNLSPVLGESPNDAVPPPSWSFGDNPALADQLLGLVLDGTKTATSTALVELEDAGLDAPRPGDLSIVVDADGEPRALLRTTEVEVVPFDAVGAEHAEAEGEDDRSLESWRVEHERYWRRVLGDDRFSTDLQVVAERFELIYPKDGPTPAVD
ncbi:ASCH domain-containing protein [Cellulomonas chitinilytica]|nr:ASCH domain-containing protein [Cellulomonas chitinilytica]